MSDTRKVLRYMTGPGLFGIDQETYFNIVSTSHPDAAHYNGWHSLKLTQEQFDYIKGLGCFLVLGGSRCEDFHLPEGELHYYLVSYTFAFANNRNKANRVLHIMVSAVPLYSDVESTFKEVPMEVAFAEASRYPIRS